MPAAKSTARTALANTDDIIFHCNSQAQADALSAELEGQLAEYGLQLHPQKTRIVYPKSIPVAGRPCGGRGGPMIGAMRSLSCIAAGSPISQGA